MTTAQPKTIEQACAFVRQATRVLPRGGGTKPALSTPSDEMDVVETTQLSGMLEYEPGEFTFTALAGTPVAQVAQTLAEHGQYLPFDPLFVERGATLGGTVAANASGPGRYHYGGLRDFLIGVRYINSNGQLIRGGGKVVKNAAGFDLPKLMVGSLGGFGVLVELSFKVLPKPEAYASLRLELDDLPGALTAMQKAAAARLDIDALDLVPEQGKYTLWVRLGGLEKALPARLERLRAAFDHRGEALQGADEARFWKSAIEMDWTPPGATVVKAALTRGRIPEVEAFLAERGVMRRYSCGGQMAWLAADVPLQEINAWFKQLRLNGTAFFGAPGLPRLGEFTGRPFYRRVKDALDPARHFMEV